MTTRGKIVFTIVFLALVGFGVSRWWPKLQPGRDSKSARTITKSDSPKETEEAGPELATTKFEVPRLDSPAPYQPKDNIVDIELSEYAGYAGLIAANGGLDPNDNSVFARKHGFKVRLKLSEEESWSALNAGKMAASATTVDVLAVYGRQFQVVVPAQIGYSRGADGIVVRKDVKRVNDLKGKVLATSQFTEADFFIRYLAQEAGLGVNMLSDLKEKPDGEKINLVYADDAFVACDHFMSDLDGGDQKMMGCVTWAPRTTEAVEESKGKATLLVTNRNLLVIADILIVNKGFAQANPKMVAGLVDGLLEGNKMVRDNPSAQLDTIGKAFKWDREKTKLELTKVHLANGPENLAFFSGDIAAAGSFSGIYQSAVLAYGSELIKDPVDADRFVDNQHLKALETAGAFAGQQIAIAPIKSSSAGPVETDPLLSKNIRFMFEPNSTKLDLARPENLQNLGAIRRMLQVSPGSSILLRGHVDPSNKQMFLQQGGQSFLQKKALEAIQLSKDRANEIKRLLGEREKVEMTRLDAVGRGWEEPVSATSMDENRRVEAQWFTLE
ncbi:MAG TPA: OmpA family protein [Chthoniobacteraceae bacterium]|nr:OmpA family protein [Chthoniobacteraceae bacterium]